jgi:hypothetical protein
MALFNWRAIDKLRQSLMTWIKKCTAGTSVAYPLDIGVHLRPEITKAQMVEGAIGIEMSTNGVGMKSHEDDIEQSFGNNLQPNTSYSRGLVRDE